MCVTRAVLYPPRGLEEAYNQDLGLPPPAGSWVPLSPSCHLRHCDKSAAEPMLSQSTQEL